MADSSTKDTAPVVNPAPKDPPAATPSTTTTPTDEAKAKADLIAKQLSEAAAEQELEAQAEAVIATEAPAREPKEGKQAGTKFDYYKLRIGKHRYIDTNGDWVVVASGTPAAEEVPLTAQEFDRLRDRFTFVRKGE